MDPFTSTEEVYSNFDNTTPQASPGTKVKAIHTYKKVKMDEIDLEVGDIITLLQVIDGGWWQGAKNMHKKTAEYGWFPCSIVELLSVADEQNLETSVFENKHKRTRSGSWFNNTMAKDNSKKAAGKKEEKHKRERSSSAPAKAVVFAPLHSTPMETVLDTSDPSLNECKDSTLPETISKSKQSVDFGKIPLIIKSKSMSESPTHVESTRPLSPTKAIRNLRNSIFTPAPVNEALEELLKSEWSYVQDLLLMSVCV